MQGENKTTIAILMQPSIFATIFVENLSYKLIFLQLFWEKVTYKFLEIRNLDAGSYFDDRFWRIRNVFATIADYILS